MKKSMYKLFIMILAIGFNLNACYAETIKLKDGRIFAGPILERSSDYIVIFYRNVPLKYYLNQIETIDENTKIDFSDPVALDRFRAIEIQRDGEISIQLQPPDDFDFMTKKEIYAIRRKQVLQYRQFVSDDYKPREEVFGQIQDNRAWWGLLGLSYYGPGKNSIVGASEESRFILNPFILVGLDHSRAYIEKDKSLTAVPIYPEPISLYWDKSGRTGRVAYNLSSFWSIYKKYYPNLNLEREFILTAYNARDLGYNYVSIVNKESRNVDVSVSLENALELIQFIHCGGSCGYPGGCNNMSPNHPEMLIKIRALPARLYLRLWKTRPSTLHDKPDMIFIIDMV